VLWCDEAGLVGDRQRRMRRREEIKRMEAATADGLSKGRATK
jgi:hypothetical protein